MYKQRLMGRQKWRVDKGRWHLKDISAQTLRWNKNWCRHVLINPKISLYVRVSTKSTSGIVVSARLRDCPWVLPTNFLFSDKYVVRAVNWISTTSPFSLIRNEPNSILMSPLNSLTIKQEHTHSEHSHVISTKASWSVIKGKSKISISITSSSGSTPKEMAQTNEPMENWKGKFKEKHLKTRETCSQLHIIYKCLNLWKTGKSLDGVAPCTHYRMPPGVIKFRFAIQLVPANPFPVKLPLNVSFNMNRIESNGLELHGERHWEWLLGWIRWDDEKGWDGLNVAPGIPGVSSAANSEHEKMLYKKGVKLVSIYFACTLPRPFTLLICNSVKEI